MKMKKEFQNPCPILKTKTTKTINKPDFFICHLIIITSYMENDTFVVNAIGSNF